VGENSEETENDASDGNPKFANLRDLKYLYIKQYVKSADGNSLGAVLTMAKWSGMVGGRHRTLEGGMREVKKGNDRISCHPPSI